MSFQNKWEGVIVLFTFIIKRSIMKRTWTTSCWRGCWYNKNSGESLIRRNGVGWDSTFKTDAPHSTVGQCAHRTYTTSPKNTEGRFSGRPGTCKLEIIQASIHKWLIAGFVKDLNTQLRMPDENIQEWCLHLLGLETSVEGPETLNSERWTRITRWGIWCILNWKKLDIGTWEQQKGRNGQAPQA